MAQLQRLFIRLVILFCLVAMVGRGEVARAADGNPEQENLRQTEITVSYTEYEWWLIRWSDNLTQCRVIIDHEGWPNGSEIYKACGKITYNEWFHTQPCASAGDRTASKDCSGLYLHLVNSRPAQKTLLVDLPPAKVWISLTRCWPVSRDNRCDKIPYLLLTGEEPLPNEVITALHLTMNGQTYNCTGETCEIPLQPTPLSGITVEFWADSSLGDSSEHFTALVRVVDSGVSTSPMGGGWYVDVLSAQWKGAPQPSCAQIWDAFPPLGGVPSWLTTPEVAGLLATDESYYYLAGRLISQGLVDASACAGGGLLTNGYADACGLEKALPLVLTWQNQFDKQIIQTAKETGVPGQLMKNIFAQESQFWPGAFKDPKEFGLGQLTDSGAEALLLWNPSFYNQFCPLVLTESACSRGYVYLSKEQQQILRGALTLQVRADCPECTGGIDLSNADFSINLFAQTLLANCSQVSRIIYNATGRSPGAVSDYESLWRFTAANYHIGPGCLSYAIYTAWARQDIMDWEHVSTYLTPACQSVITYINKVTR